MGLAASQARYLALTARKSDLEFQSQAINTRRIQLAYKTSEIARAYSEGMNNQKIKISSLKNNETVWEEVTYQNLYNAGYMIIGTGGAGFGDQQAAPYVPDGEKTKEVKYTPNGGTITKDAYDKLDAKDKKAYCENDAAADGTYKLRTDVTEDEYKEFSADIKKLFSEGSQYHLNYKPNPDYVGPGTEKNMDIQTMLNSGRGQIVSKAFFDYLVEKWGYDYANGISPAQYAKALEEWNSGNKDINPTGESAITDWRADEKGKFQQRNYTEDDEQVHGKYQADTAQIQAQDKLLEAEEKQIETQHKAIETELESIQKVIQNNIEKTFKIFS